jgi:putative ABC transport system ATP-binding protein
VTHDQRVIDVADRLIHLVDGRIAYDVRVGESLEICEFLKQCDVFESLSPAELLAVAEEMGRERIPAGETIIRQGEEGDLFYLLRDGVVEVFVDGQRVALLGRGEFFGEHALITGEPRNATVVVADDADVYTLGEQDFRRALDASASFKDQVLEVLFKRT